MAAWAPLPEGAVRGPSSTLPVLSGGVPGPVTSAPGPPGVSSKSFQKYQPFIVDGLTTTYAGVGLGVGVGVKMGVNVAVAVGVEVAVAVAVAVAVGVGACTVSMKVASVNAPQLSVARMVIVWVPAGAASLIETTPVPLSTLIVPV